jgi:hypothetical protein
MPRKVFIRLQSVRDIRINRFVTGYDIANTGAHPEVRKQLCGKFV